MNEQEQAQALARWLEQPAGTPPPEGLDPEVVESMYALRPELAPGPSLTADDILSGFDFGGAGGDEGEGGDTLADGGSPIPPTEVRPAPAPWRAANRVAGIGVLLATAATLLLVALPAVQQSEPAQMAAPEVASAPARQSTPDPIASVADEPAADLDAPAAAAPPQMIAEANQQAVPAEPVVTGDVGAVTGEGSATVGADAVADAVLDEELDEAEGDAFRMEQRSRFDGEDVAIPEVEEALREQWEPEAQGAEADYGLADAEEAPPTASQVPQYDAPENYASKGAARPPRKNKRQQDAAPAAAESAPEAAPEPAPTYRSAATPADVDDRWRQATDAATEGAIDAALAKARAEVELGNTARAVDHLLPLVTAPAMAGQYVATVAVQYQLAAGQVTGAISTSQRGLGLSQENTPYRALLLKLYGDALDRAGDRGAAEAQWEAAASLNATR